MGGKDMAGRGQSRDGRSASEGSGGADPGRRGRSGSRARPRERSVRLDVLRQALARALAPAVALARTQLPRLRPDFPRPGRTGWRRWVPSWRQWLGACLYAFLGVVGFVTIAYAVTDIPDDLNSFAKQQDNVYYWADGSTMARTGWVSRQEMPLDKVPPKVRGAVLAAENASFYSDPGVSPSGVLRAVRAGLTGARPRAGPPSRSST